MSDHASRLMHSSCSHNEAKPALPPLDADEAWVLGVNMLFTQAMLLAAGAVLVLLSTGIATGEWLEATVGFGWVRVIGDSLAALPLPATLVLGCAAGTLLALAAWANERRALRSEKGRAAVLKARQGINGELPRLPVPALVALLVLTGFAEELLFRLGMIGLVESLLAGALPPAAAGAVALLASSVAFWLAHARYRDPLTSIVVLALGLALGGLFMATGSLAVAALAHALYDLAVVLIDRTRMRRDPSFFGGPAPTRALLDQLEEKERTERPAGE